MASIRTYHTINIFDIRAVDYALATYPPSYKYILQYTTFGKAESYTWNKDGNDITTVTKPYSIYSFLIENSKVIDVIQVERHNYELDIYEMDPMKGYITFDHHGSKCIMMHMMDRDGIYTILIAENKPDYDNVMVIGDDINDINRIIEHTDTHTIVIMTHESSNLAANDSIVPAYYMISYISFIGVLHKFVFYTDYVMVQDVGKELLRKYAPQIIWDDHFNFDMPVI